jgi:hypothetical protein
MMTKAQRNAMISLWLIYGCVGPKNTNANNDYLLALVKGNKAKADKLADKATDECRAKVQEELDRCTKEDEMVEAVLAEYTERR